MTSSLQLSSDLAAKPSLTEVQVKKQEPSEGSKFEYWPDH